MWPVTLMGRPLSLSYGAILPSSLTRVLSRALGSSPRLPVSVCGTGAWSLASGFSWQHGIGQFSGRIRTHSRLGLPVARIYLRDTLLAWTGYSISLLCLPFCVPASLKRDRGSTGISTRYPSPTPFGLGLGPGSP